MLTTNAKGRHVSPGCGGQGPFVWGPMGEWRVPWASYKRGHTSVSSTNPGATDSSASPTDTKEFEVNMKCPAKALKEALQCAQSEERLTVGVYECAQVMNEEPDSVSFCVLAVDEQFEWDVALQIHFTLIQSFCFDNDISIVRVSDRQRLQELVGRTEEDAHCVLISGPCEGAWDEPSVEKLRMFCEERRALNDWVPEISLPER